jgi:hypothetical protein
MMADGVADSIPFSLSQLLLLLIVRVSGFRLTRFAQIYADKRRGLPRYRAAEVCSAEATELPVGKDLRSLWQTDFATPWALDNESSGSRRYTRKNEADCRELGL